MRIDAGRHPVIEKLSERDAIRFRSQRPVSSLVKRIYRRDHGPEHGRKEHLLAAGSLDFDHGADWLVHVPADAALLPVVDRVFTRIGAADNLARGRSTFMVEMTEAAAILNTASSE